MEKERLAEHLERYHSGASNAATSRELECAFGIKGKELRDAVNALRREGVPIASNGSGYFYAATEQEVRAIRWIKLVLCNTSRAWSTHDCPAPRLLGRLCF